MRSSAILIFGLLCWQSAAGAQTINNNIVPDEGSSDRAAKTGVIGGESSINRSTYAPPTMSERLRMYVVSAFGPQAILRAAAGAGIAQWDNTPKEWKQGSEAYGERFGNVLAEHVIYKTLEAGASAVLHEDDRYFLSTDTGFGKRLKHAVGSAFVTRNPAGEDRFAYARFGAALGSAFISRAWQPPSKNSAGDAAVTFGINMAVDMGWNVFKEFRPKRLGRGF